MTQTHQIKTWYENVLPLPTDIDVHYQIHDHISNFQALFRTLAEAGRTYSSREQLGFIADVLDFSQRQFKAGNIDIALEDTDRAVLLATLCNQITTSIGIAHALRMDIVGALETVAAAKDKMIHPEQPVVFDEQHQTIPPQDHVPVDLVKYAERTLL